MSEVNSWVKRLSLVSIISLTVLIAPLSAQEVDWEKAYGGNEEEEGYWVTKTYDRGYIVTGYTASYGAGGKDVYIMKIDEKGDTVWTRTYGGSDDDEGRCVIETRDTQYVIVGYTASYGAYPGYKDIYLLKIDRNGDTLWTHTYGGPDDEIGYQVVETPDGGFIIAGYTASYGAGSYDIYLVKTDENGDTLWTKTYGSGGLDKAYGIIRAIDSGYVVVGEMYVSGTGSEVCLLKIDETGDTLFTKTYGGNGGGRGYSVISTSDGGYFITGTFSGLNYDVYLVKINDAGDTIWTRVYGRLPNEYGYSAREIPGQGYIVGGYISGTDEYIWLLRLGQNGDTIWTKIIGGDNVHRCYSIENGWGGGWILTGAKYVGTSNSDVYLMKTNEVIIKSPMPGEVMRGGENYTLKFKCANKLGEDYLRILYSIDGGASYPYIIADNIPVSDTFYIWTIPVISSSRCRVKIQALSIAGDTLGEDECNGDFMIDSDAPMQVELVEPENGGYSNQDSVIFIWHVAYDSVSGTESYTYQRAFDSMFTLGVVEINTGSDTALVQYLSDSVYYWRVRAIDRAGNIGEWSSVYRLEVDTDTPQVPALLFPDSGSWVAESVVVFEWEAVTKFYKSPVRYVLMVDTASSFTTSVLIDTTGFTQDTVSLIDGTYFWKVKAYDLAGNESSWSSAWQINIDLTPPRIDSVTVWSDTGYYFGPFNIKAKVTDNGGLHHPLLYYRVGNGVWVEDTMVSLFDNWYVDTIPEVDSQISVKIEYYILAEDYAGNVSRDPDTGAYSFNVGIYEKKKNRERYRIKEIVFDENNLIIRYTAPQNAKVTIALYDITGRVIRKITKRARARSNEVSVPRTRLHKGVYFVEMKSNIYREIRKLLLVK